MPRSGISWTVTGKNDSDTMISPIEIKELLVHIRILDLAGNEGGFCGKALADLGAQVVKVQNPAGAANGSEAGLFGQYHDFGKSTACLDLEQEPGRRELQRMVPSCDAIIESFRLGYMDSLGLGFEALKKINPGLIMASITGFGQDGPRRNWKSCDLAASALAGQMFVTGTPSLPPLRMHGEQSWYTAGLFAAIGILLGLRRRTATGLGTHIDVSLQESVASTLDHVMVRYFYNGENACKAR